MHDKLPVNSNHCPEIQHDIYLVTKMEIYLNLYLFCISIDTNYVNIQMVLLENSFINLNNTYPIYGFDIMV